MIVSSFAARGASIGAGAGADVPVAVVERDEDDAFPEAAERAGTMIEPRGEETRTSSPSVIPSLSASAGNSSTQGSGAAACSSGARRSSFACGSGRPCAPW